MAEGGMNPEVQKIGLKQRVVEAFTPKGAKEKWYRDHADVVKKYADVANTMTEEQRAQVMDQIDDRASKDANLAVLGKWGAVALTTATLGVGGGLIKSETFRNWVGKAHIGKLEVGKPFQKFGEKGAEMGEKALDFLKSIPDRANRLKDRVFKKAPSAAPAANPAG